MKCKECNSSEIEFVCTINARWSKHLYQCNRCKRVFEFVGDGIDLMEMKDAYV